MQVIKKENEFGLNIIFEENDKYITFTFGGNLNLYWSIHRKCKDINDDYKYDYFIVTKEKYGVYKLFEELFYNIENINICNIEDFIPFYITEDEEKKEDLEIQKEENTFKIEFYTQPYKEGYDKDFHSVGYIPIKFHNSGSPYDPFNQIYMRMYNSMNEIDDINDIGHQIHIEEYLYNEGKIKKLIK